MRLIIYFSGILLLFAMLAVSSCSDKYAEGPGFSIYSANKRVEGKWRWTLARVTSRGEVSNLSKRLQNDTLNLSKDGLLSESLFGIKGSWELVSKAKELNLIFVPSAQELGLEKEASAFQILLLKQNEMWLQFSEDSLLVEWQLKAIK